MAAATAAAAAARLSGLKNFTTCDIGDALVKLKYPLGGFLDGIAMWSPGWRAPGTKILGPTITVKMVDEKDTSAPRLSSHFCDANEAGKIMYIQQPQGMYSACWGGLMSTRASFLGASGVIVDGRFRDIGEHREMGFPVFGREPAVPGSNTFTRSSELNVPLQFKDDLWVHPGDFLMGDQDGAVVIPPSLSEQVIAICAERAEIDAKTMEALRAGEAIGPTIKRLRK